MKGIRKLYYLCNSFASQKLFHHNFFLKSKIKTFQIIKQSTDTSLVENSPINHTHTYKPMMFIHSLNINILGTYNGSSTVGFIETNETYMFF